MDSIFIQLGFIFLASSFLVGLVAIVIRRLAIWGLVGQIICVKTIVVAAFLLSGFLQKQAPDLLMISLLALSLLPAIVAVSIVVVQRSGRFGGTLDFEQEKQLRH